MSAPTLTRVRVEPVGRNLELLKYHSIQRDELREAARRHSIALGSPVGSLSVPYETARNPPPPRHSNELSLLITSPQAARNRRNKTSSTVGRLNVESSHFKYLNSLNDSGWVAQCLNGEKCIQEAFKKFRQNNHAPEQPVISNPIQKSTNNSERISWDKPGDEVSEMPSQNVSRSSVSGDGIQDDIKPREADMENMLPLNISSSKLINQTISKDNTSLSNEFNQVPEVNYSTYSPDIHVFPQNTKGEKLQYKSFVVKIPLPAGKGDRTIFPASIEDYQPSKNSEEITTLAREEDYRKESIRPNTVVQNENGFSKMAKGDFTLPVSIHLQPLIHNHYYNRRDTKSAKNTPDELSPPHYEFRPLVTQVNQNSMTDISQIEAKTDSSKALKLCDHLNTTDCFGWASVENLASGDLAARSSTGKRQSEGDPSEEYNEESEIKARISNTQYPEVAETLPSNKHANSNIFLIMGGQWHINMKDQDPEIVKMKLQNNMQPTPTFHQELISPTNERASSDDSRWYPTSRFETPSSFSKQSSGSTFQNAISHPRALPLCHTNLGNPSLPVYPNQNVATPMAGKSSMTDDIFDSDYPYGYYSSAPSEYNIAPESEREYDYFGNGEGNQRPWTLSQSKPRMFYPESLVNFPLSNIKKYQGDNMEYQQAPVKPEEHALHDMTPNDMLLVGAQLLPIMQASDLRLPEPEYPLQPLSNDNSYSSSDDYSPSVRDSSIAGNSKQLDSDYDYKKMYQMSSIYNTYPSGGYNVFLPQRILINGQGPLISYSARPLPWEQTRPPNSWLENAFGEHDFVDGQFVKWNRSAEVNFKHTSSDNRESYQPVRSAYPCQR